MTKRMSSKTKETLPWFEANQSKKEVVLHFRGPWVCSQLSQLEKDLEAWLEDILSKKILVNVIIEKECSIDSSGACLMARCIKKLKHFNLLNNLNIYAPTALLDHFLQFQLPEKSAELPVDRLTSFLGYIGYSTVLFSKTSLKMLNFFGEILVTYYKTLKSTRKFRWVSIFRHAEEVGIRALPIIGLISFLIGMVLSYQSINQLNRFGAELYTIDFLGISLLREIAVLITAIVVAGRSGSAFAAQIGTMALNQEIDAIKMLSLNPILVLVIPRLIAITLCLPCLVFFSMMMGLCGGIMMTNIIIDVTPLQFIHQLNRAVSLNTFWVGMSKAPLFAIIIGLVGCFRGLQVKGSAESVGRMTTQAVVESIFLVIVCDAFMSILFSYLKV